MDSNPIVPEPIQPLSEELAPAADLPAAVAEVAVPAAPCEENAAQPALSDALAVELPGPAAETPAAQPVDAPLPVETSAEAESAAAPFETGQPSRARRRHTGLIVAIIVVVVLLLAAGGGYAYLRMSEGRLLDQAQAAQKAADWAGVQDNCAQLAALPLQSLLVDPQRCLPLRGEALFQTGKLDPALADLQAANLRYPDQARPYTLITLIYAQQGKTELALTAGAEALKHDDSFALPYTLQAVDALRRNQYKDAETAAQAALKRDPKQTAALRVLGTLESWRGDAQALEHLSQAIALDPSDIAALAARGCFNFEQGRISDFDTDIAAALSISMTAPESLELQAIRAYLDHDLQKAYKLIDQVIQQKNDRAEYYYYRAIFYPTTEKESKTALADLDKTLQLNPDFYKAQATKSLIHFSNFDTVDMVAEGNRLIAAAPGLGSGQRLLITHYLRLRDWEQAMEWANKYVEKFPASAGAYNLRGQVYTGQQKYALAIADFLTAIKLNPNSLDARFGLASVHSLQKEPGDAMTYLNEAVSKAPNSPEAYAQRALMYLYNDDNAKARTDVEKALELDPLNIGGLTARAEVNIDEADFTRAMEDITRIADLYPKAPYAHILRGMVYLEQKDKDAQRALDEFKQAIDILPSDSSAQGWAAMASYDLKNYDQAMTYANACLKLDPKDSVALGMLAEIYYQKKDYSQAITNAKLSIDLKPSNTWLYLLMADANVALGDYQAATQNLNDALAHKDNLNADDLQSAEKDVAFYATVPPLVDGLRTVTDKTSGFSIAYSAVWTPTPVPPDNEYSKLYLKDSDAGMVRILLEVDTYSSPYAYLLTAQMFADYYRQTLTLQSGYKFTSRAAFKGQEYGTVDTFEASYENSSGDTVTIRGLMYVFYVTGKPVMITVFGPPDEFAKLKAEADKVAASFKFIK